MPPSTPSMVLSSYREPGLSSVEMKSGAVPAVLADLPLLELLHHCASKPEMAKFTSLLFVSGGTEPHTCTVPRLGHTGRQW